MAINRFTIDGYGQLELNQVAFRRTGRVEAQCALSTNDFSDSAPLENGMIVSVDKVNNMIKKPSATDNLPKALNYTTEHMYDERKPGLKNFCLTPSDELYPRVGYLSVGEIFTTNTFCYDTTTYATQTAVESALASCATSAVYGTYETNGCICLVTAAPTVSPAFKVVKYTTMPDGTKAAKFQVIG